MWNHNQLGVCITCNWAAGTRLVNANGKPDEKPKCIELSWSCIYKKNAELSIENVFAALGKVTLKKRSTRYLSDSMNGKW